jgi:hypothetical protein
MATKTEAEAGARPSLMQRFRGANAGSQFKQGAGGVASILAKIVLAISFIAAGILVLHIIFVMFKGNPANDFVAHIDDYANSLAGFFKDLFSFKNPKTNTLVNFGIAAAVWVVVGRVIASLLERIK